MDMTFTESQRALIGEIVEEKLRLHALDAKKDSEKLTEDIKALLLSHNESIMLKLDIIKDDYRSRIDRVIMERNHRFEVVELKMESCKSNCVRKKDVWIISGKLLSAVGAVVTIIISIIALVV